MAAAVTPRSPSGGQRPLQLVSWNVASWKTTLREIVGRHGSLDAWLGALRPDVLCLQETKLSDAELDKDPKGLGALPSGYETFWACNEGKGEQTKGLNGVCTLARAGLAVRAERHALRDEALDHEGRCLLVELRTGVVVVNVYVPNSGDGRLPVKLAFLDALAGLLARERASGKRVVLCGDLNLQTRALDTHWRRRRLRLAALAQAERAGGLERAALWPPGGGAGDAPPDERGAEQAAILEGRALELARLLGRGHDAIARTLAASEIRECETVNTTTGRRFQKYRLYVPAQGGEARAAGAVSAMQAVGKPYETRGEASYFYSFGEVWAALRAEPSRGGAPRAADGEPIRLHREGEMRMEQLRDVAAAVLGSSALEGYSDDAWAQLGRALPFVRASTEEAVHARFERLCGAGGGLVDTFVRAHPHALDRFTWCAARGEDEGWGAHRRPHALRLARPPWSPHPMPPCARSWNQFTQERFVNVGSRIDYILAPPEMLLGGALPGVGAAGAGGALARAAGGSGGRGSAGGGGLRPPAGALCTGGTVHDADSPMAALAAATANGRWRQVPFSGGGYVDGQAKDYWFHLEAHRAHTGMIYTPPQYSDHVAICALLSFDFAAAAAEAGAQAATPKFGSDVQPFLKQLKQQGLFSSWLSKGPAKREAAPSAEACAAGASAAAAGLAAAGSGAGSAPPAAAQPTARGTQPPPAVKQKADGRAAGKAEPPKKQQRGAMDAFVRRGA